MVGDDGVRVAQRVSDHQPDVAKGGTCRNLIGRAATVVSSLEEVGHRGLVVVATAGGSVVSDEHEVDLNRSDRETVSPTEV